MMRVWRYDCHTFFYVCIMPAVNLIWAQAHNRVIGINGAMPWHLPEDLAHFKRVTLGATVIMGRKTWESLPERFRPLPNRINIVISRQTDFLAGKVGISLQAAPSLQAALHLASQHSDVWVIGGAQIYGQALPLASKLIITEIDADFAGDAFAPKLGSEWMEVARESHMAANGLAFAFLTYTKAQ
jgi:dihydrofolate reductase